MRRRGVTRLFVGGTLALLLAGPTIGGGRAAPSSAHEAAVASRSIAFFEARLAADPTNTLAAGRLADRYLLRFRLAADPGDVERAESLARAALPLAASPATAWARLSGIHLVQHEFAEAWVASEHAVATDSGDPGAWSARFDAAMAVGRYPDAERALARLAPGSPARRVALGRWLAARGRTEEAFGELAAVCRELDRRQSPAPARAWCLTELAALDHACRGPAAAEATYRSALAVLPGYPGALEGLADLTHARRDWDRAEELYRQIAADAHPDLYLRLAEVRRERGDERGARRWEDAFLRVAAAPDAEPLYGAWLAQFWAERPTARDRALAVALREVERRPTVESWDGLAWVRFWRGELAGALAASDRALAWGSPSPTMEYRRGRILMAIGRRAEGRALIDRALADPSLLEPEARIDAVRWTGSRPGSLSDSY